MNAFELAKKLDEYNADGCPVLVVEQAADMLRQQADRIADLETTLAFKKMKPLSDEEINKIIDRYTEVGVVPSIEFAKEIEERHGIK